MPGDLLTDLVRAGLLGDPLYSNNFDFYNSSGHIEVPFWEKGNVSYSTMFTVDSALLHGSVSEIMLVMDGIKMAAGIWLNDVYLGTTANQFVRWSFPVLALLQVP